MLAPPRHTPIAPPRLNRVGEARPNSAPPTPTPSAAQTQHASSQDTNGRHKTKSWFGKLIKKLSHTEDPHPWQHRRTEESAAPRRPRLEVTGTAGERTRARATTPPAGSRQGTGEREAIQRRRSTDPRPPNSSGNRDRDRGALTARATSTRRPPDETGPDSLCLFFMRGECPNGRLCPYRHPGEETLFGLSPRTIIRTIRRALDTQNSQENAGPANRAAQSGANRSSGSRRDRSGSDAAGGSDAARAARRRHSTGTGPQTGPEGAHGATATPARPKRPTRVGLTDNEIEMLPSFPFRPLSEAEMAEADHRQTECQICLDDFEEGANVRAMPCFHVFHAHCVGLWLKKHKTCPFCQTEVKLEVE